MAHKKCLETLGRTLENLQNNQNRLGVGLILLAGYFHQSIISGSTPADERVESQDMVDLIEPFLKQLIDIGNREIVVDVFDRLPYISWQFTESKTELKQ